MAVMPVLFVGHGSPMNAIEDNEFTRGWKRLAEVIPKPKAVLCVSAHWYVSGLRVMGNARPCTIYDFYGFPRELNEIVYPAPGAPDLAHKTQALLGGAAMLDDGWGFDHGAWSVLRVMYPDAQIPVWQLSVDRNAPPEIQYETGKKLKALRDEGVLILGSGNVVHNLAQVDFDKPDGYGWATEFDNYIHDAIQEKQHDKVIHYLQAGECARKAFPTPDHYFPLLTVLGASQADDRVTVTNNQCAMGSLSMTCYLWG